MAKMSLREMEKKTPFLKLCMIRGVMLKAEEMGVDRMEIFPQKTGSEEWEIDFTVNGRELASFEIFEEILKRGREDYIKEQALQLINDKFNDIDEAVYELREEIKDKVKSVCNQFKLQLE